MNIPQGPWYIDDLLTFTVVTTVFATGVATDADAVPAYRVYEDETGTAILTGNMALLDSANTAGFYSEQITLSAANGFEVGKTYSIYAAATVSSVAGATSGGFKVVASVVAANVTQISGDATAADNAEAFFDGTGYAGTNNVIPTVTTLTNLPAITANWLTAAGTAADFGTEVGTAVWAAATRTLTAGTNIDGSTFTAIPWNAAWDAEVQSEVTDALVAYNAASTTNITAGTITNVTTVDGLAANVITAASIAADAGAEIADAFLNRDMSTGTDSGSTTVRTPRQALRAMRNKWIIAAGTLTVYKEDDSTSSWTSALTGTAGADPITTSDPAGP